MNNQIPYIQGFNQNHDMFGYNMPNNPNEMILERINNRLNRLERQIKIIENRLNRLENVNIMPLNNNQDDSNMYML